MRENAYQSSRQDDVKLKSTAALPT